MVRSVEILTAGTLAQLPQKRTFMGMGQVATNVTPEAKVTASFQASTFVNAPEVMVAAVTAEMDTPAVSSSNKTACGTLLEIGADVARATVTNRNSRGYEAS